MYIDMQTVVLLMVSAIVGYFLLFWIQVVIILALVYYLANRSGNDSDLVRLYIVSMIAGGLVIGNLIYIIPQIKISFNQVPAKNWFLR